MAAKLYPFDMSEVLDSEEAIAMYFDMVLADGDQDEMLRALGHIAKARGMTKVAHDAGLGRESLYKALAPGANPAYATVDKVMKAVGLQIRAAPSTHGPIVKKAVAKKVAMAKKATPTKKATAKKVAAKKNPAMQAPAKKVASKFSAKRVQDVGSPAIVKRRA